MDGYHSTEAGFYDVVEKCPKPTDNFISSFFRLVDYDKINY
jgi:hypothetical protein